MDSKIRCITSKLDDKSHSHTLPEALALVTLLASQTRQDMLVGKHKKLSMCFALTRDMTELGLTAPQERSYKDRSDRTDREVFLCPISTLYFLHFFISRIIL